MKILIAIGVTSLLVASFGIIIFVVSIMSATQTVIAFGIVIFIILCLFVYDVLFNDQGSNY